MPRKLTAALLVLSLVCGLTACASGPRPSPAGSGSPEGGEGAPGPAGAEERLEALGRLPVDPPFQFDPEQMQPGDFGPWYEAVYGDCQVSAYPILEGTEYENTVTVLQGAQEGPVIYVIAGVHGDEQAAWHTGNLLKKISIKAGRLYILSPANPWGAGADPPVRYVTGREDLNRSFPGDPEGTPAQRVAAAILADVTRAEPDFVFDLHEAKTVNSQLDFLGSTLIFTDLAGMEELFLALLAETGSGRLCSEPFQCQGPGPEGSVNKTITQLLHIPVVTVETFRRYEMERRIGDQLAITEYVLEYYGMR